MDTFGERLKALRGEKDLSQEEFGKLFNLSQSIIAYYELNKKDPPSDTLVKFADFFGVSLDYLFGRTTVRTPPEELLEEGILAAHLEDGYDKPLDPKTRAYIDFAVEEALEKRKKWLKNK